MKKILYGNALMWQNCGNKERTGRERSRSDQGGRDNDMIARQYPCDGQVCSTAARQFSVPFLATFLRRSTQRSLIIMAAR